MLIAKYFNFFYLQLEKKYIDVNVGSSHKSIAFYIHMKFCVVAQKIYMDFFLIRKNLLILKL